MAVRAYQHYAADLIVGEVNNGRGSDREYPARRVSTGQLALGAREPWQAHAH